jgi:hypothetical protein
MDAEISVLQDGCNRCTLSENMGFSDTASKHTGMLQMAPKE